MTPAPQYYPVTKDELNFIKNDCIHPESDKCLDECTAWNSKELVCDFGANLLMDSVLAREPCPTTTTSASSDVLELLKKCESDLDDIKEMYREQKELRQQTKER
jgi:hypothetical protein